MALRVAPSWTRRERPSAEGASASRTHGTRMDTRRSGAVGTDRSGQLDNLGSALWHPRLQQVVGQLAKPDGGAIPHPGTWRDAGRLGAHESQRAHEHAPDDEGDREPRYRGRDQPGA